MRCKYCGFELSTNAKFCPQCGMSVEKEETLNFNQPPLRKKGNNEYKILILVAIVLLVSLSGIFSGISAKKKNDTENQLKDNSYFVSEKESDDGFADQVSEIQESEEVFDESEEEIHSYDFFIDDCTWSEAFMKAQEYGGYLVHINSREEYDYILDLIYQYGYENIQFRVGARRDIGSTDYYWVNKNNMTYGTKINDSSYWLAGEWMPGEPSFIDNEIEEPCIEFYYNKKEERWVWNDVPDDIISIVPYYSGNVGYIVEYEE